MRILFVLLLAGCGDSMSMGIVDCDPGVYPDTCSSAERCDATTKKCEAVKSCTKDSECSGYTCSVSNACERNCHSQTGATNDFCSAGYLCNQSFVCVKISTCDPAMTDNTQCNGLPCDAATKTCKASATCTDDSACGNYHCETFDGFCRLSCNDNSQCATGKTCDTATSSCK